MRRYNLLALALVVGCAEDAPIPADSAPLCATPRGAAYPPGSSYGGVHAGPRNDDFVDCETPPSWNRSWHALQGRVIAQPNTFSPDGNTTYVTTSQPGEGECTVHALDVATGEPRWCIALAGAIGSSVEVDADGNLYVASDTQLVSLDANGAERWKTEIPQPAESDNPNGAIGLHFDAQGRIVTLTDLGVVMVLSRADGAVLASLDIPAATGFVPAASLPGGLDVESLVPEAVIADFEAINGTDFDLLTFIGSGGQFSDNTVGIGPDDVIYTVGGGPNPNRGALVRIEWETAESLRIAWTAPFNLGSASSPSISADGRWVRISDGNSPAAVFGIARPNAGVLLFDTHACGANADSDPEPTGCAPAIELPLEAPALGAAPVFNDAEHYYWEVSFADLYDNTVADVFAFSGDATRWSTHLPDDAVWSSVLTLTRNHIVGTMTRVTPSESEIFAVQLPDTAESEVVVLDRADGELVFRAPITDDATSTVTVGPDGSLYVNQLGLLHAFAVTTTVTGGVVRFAPEAPAGY